MAAIMSLMVILIINMARKSSTFWEEAKELENKIDAASNKEELKHLYTEDLKTLNSKAQGAPHYYETKRLADIITTKHKYITQ